MILGVVADDVTGANDIGSMASKVGYAAHIFAFTGHDDFPVNSAPHVCILDTNSRLDAPQTAYHKAFAASVALQRAGCRQFFNKTCSVFRGNIGVEFDAMLDATGHEFAVVILGFPKNGRTTVDGIHYVHGVRLEDSEFRNDPIHPMTRSDLVGILGSQTQRKVDLLIHKIVRQGPAVLRQHIAHMRSHCNYLILDVTSQDDLAIIAAAVHDEPVLCGSSAVAEELTAFWDAPAADDPTTAPPYRSELGILCTAGSLMPQTAAQIACLGENGAFRCTLDTGHIFDSDDRQQEIDRLTDLIAGQMLAGRDVMFHSPIDPAGVAATRQAGAAAGWSPDAIAHGVSSALAEVTARVLARTGQNRLIVAGGETSAAACRRLSVHEMRVWKEIRPGLPSCLTLTDPPLLLVLKSGSFGQPDFFQHALEHLRTE